MRRPLSRDIEGLNHRNIYDPVGLRPNHLSTPRHLIFCPILPPKLECHPSRAGETLLWLRIIANRRVIGKMPLFSVFSALSLVATSLRSPTFDALLDLGRLEDSHKINLY
jgi:hypothetical protein